MSGVPRNSHMYTPTVSRSALNLEMRAKAISSPSGNDITMVTKNISNVTTVPSNIGPSIPKM
ncbi:hypothetical protein SDC9_149938 [bioreactor metagenome]|uniref:Uncharacterized protein n=1 Tax=bioreactor metagenome TaxID=1076179 RepID=A0A645EN81_9ZZZZ